MFARRYFPARGFAPRYWPAGSDLDPSIPAAILAVQARTRAFTLTGRDRALAVSGRTRTLEVQER